VIRRVSKYWWAFGKYNVSCEVGVEHGIMPAGEVDREERSGDGVSFDLEHLKQEPEKKIQPYHLVDTFDGAKPRFLNRG
jgi:hypothetical protein